MSAHGKRCCSTQTCFLWLVTLASVGLILGYLFRYPECFAAVLNLQQGLNMAEKPVGGVEQLESSMGISPGANIQARRFMATHISPRDDKHPQRPIPTAISENDTLEQLNLDIMQFKYPYHRTSTSKILLVTFYRGGSSFLGELFRFNPDFLYWFEPLHGIYFQHLNDPESRLDLHGDADTYVMLDNGTIRSVDTAYQEEILQELVNVFSCNFAQINPLTLHDPFMDYTPSLRTPLRSSKCTSVENPSSRCQTALEEACLQRPFAAVKTVRLGLYMLPSLMDEIPELKVLYYVRDPRAILNSRLRVHENSTYIKRDMAILCHTVAENHRYYQKLEARHPTRLKLIRYEDLALSPIDTARDIYRFIGSDWDATTEQWLKKIVNTDKPSRYGTFRIAKNVVKEWERHLPTAFKRKMEKLCHQALILHKYEKKIK